ncbi:hypothetical protein [Domibacillus robiginosus]|uniref:hypothetical protein n=1 Tax=Domibacillus robiginosus TaxID=1071054 RepID=UPI00067E46C1|nr:hypothetical protein [Domibacillus robiginosus]
MKRLASILAGLVFGAVLSVICGTLFGLASQSAAGGYTSFFAESWLYYAVLIPFMVAFSLIGAYANKFGTINNKKRWMLSFTTAFFVTLYIGTVGAIFGEYIARGGMETIIIESTLGWGVIYAFVLLPFTVPAAWLLISEFIQLLHKLSLIQK